MMIMMMTIMMTIMIVFGCVSLNNLLKISYYVIIAKNEKNWDIFDKNNYTIK